MLCIVWWCRIGCLKPLVGREVLSGHTVYALPHGVVIVDGDVAVLVGMVVQQFTEFVHHLIDDLRGRWLPAETFLTVWIVFYIIHNFILFD